MIADHQVIAGSRGPATFAHAFGRHRRAVNHVSAASRRIAFGTAGPDWLIIKLALWTAGLDDR